MGFRIESLSGLSASASRIDERVKTMIIEKKRAIAALNNITEAVSGSSIKDDLMKLAASIEVNSNAIIDVLETTSKFINLQISKYSANETELNEKLKQAQAELESIDFN